MAIGIWSILCSKSTTFTLLGTQKRDEPASENGFYKHFTP